MLSEHGGHVDRLVLRTQTNSSAGELTQIERRLHMASLDGSGTARGPVARWNHRADGDVCRAPHG